MYLVALVFCIWKELVFEFCQQLAAIARDATQIIYPAWAQLGCANRPIVIVTNTIPLPENAPSKITQLSVAPILGEAISRIHDDESISQLFGFEKEYKG